MTVRTKYSALKQKAGLLLISLSYAPAMFADGTNWFPKPDSTMDMSSGQSGMTIIGNLLKKGGTIFLFVAAIVMFVKFMSTASHGIEVAKKNEGSLTDFTSYILMAIIYLAMSLTAGYLGYSVITKFSV